MLARMIVLLGVATLSASAQTPFNQKAASHGLCQAIATAAFQANRNLGIWNTREERSAPFVSKWLVQRGLASDANGGLRQIGRRESCAAVSESCHYLGPYQLPADTPEMDIPGHPDSGEPDVQFSYGDNASVGMLPVRSEFMDVRAWHEFGSESGLRPTGAFLKSVFDGKGLVCAFDNRLHETYSGNEPDEETPETCAALFSDGSEILEPDPKLPPGLNQETFRDPAHRSRESGTPYSGAGTFTPQGILNVDVDGDGAEEMLVHIQWAGLGDRCLRYFYDVLDSRDPSKLSSAPVREAVRQAQGTASPGVGASCRGKTRIRRVENRILFEYSGLDPVDKSGTPVVTREGGPLERVLREVRGGQMRYLCSTRFAIEPVVLYAR